MTGQLVSYIRNQFSLDLRSVSLMRILIGSVLLLDILIRVTDLKAHYTDDGVLPLNALFSHAWNPWLFSLHTMSSNAYFQGILFIIQIAFACTLIIGYRTRLSTIVSWILLVSVHNRNPMILQGGDDLLRMLLFWTMFIPWGAYYSADSNYTKTSETKIFSTATLGYMIQVGAVYFFSAMLKTSPEWRTENTALYYALSLDQLVLPAGQLIYPYYELLKSLTFIVFRLELFIPILLLIPLFNGALRNIAAVMFILLHIGIGASLFVGLFFLIGISSSVGLLSGKFMDKLHEKLQRFTSTHQSIQPTATLSAPVQLALTGILIYILVWNIDTTRPQSIIPSSFKASAYALRINQNWGMFSPGVFKDDGWYIFEGQAGKNIIDLNRFGSTISYEKPDRVVSLFRNDRWRKFSENYLFISNSWLRPYYTRYLLNEWNSTHPKNKISSLKIVYMKEVTGRNYLHKAPCREVLSEVIP